GPAWVIAKDFAADTTSKNASNDKWHAVPYAQTIQMEARRLVVCRKNDKRGLCYLSVQVWCAHEVNLVLLDLYGRISIEKDVRQCVGFILAEIPTSANVSDNVLRFEHVRIEQREPP